MKIIKSILKVLFALIFIAAGSLHIARPEVFLRIMPSILPFPLFIVYLSGACEIILGVLLLVPKYSRLAAWGLVILLIAVYPANIYMALNPQLFPDIQPSLIYLRLPLQFVLIAWAYWFTLPEKQN